MDNNLGDIISKLRKEKNYTQKDLADKICVSDKSISRYETGKSQPDLETIYLLSKIFGVSFNDLLKVRVSTDNKDSNLVKEIINEFSEINKKHSKVLKIVLAVTLAIIVILSVTMIFTASYNRFKVYNVVAENENVLFTKGIYIETRIKDTLILKNLKIRNYTLSDSDLVTIDLLYKENNKENIIQNFSNMDGIVFSIVPKNTEIQNLSDYFNELYIRIKIIHENNKIDQYESKLSFILDFSNNKIFYKEYDEIDNSYNIDLTNEEINKILLNSGFEKINDDLLFKNLEKYEIHYFVNTNRVNFKYEDKSFIYKINYNIKNKILNVSVFDESNVEVENYEYNASTNKVTNCVTGKCNGYKDVMKLIDQNFLTLLKK